MSRGEILAQLWKIYDVVFKSTGSQLERERDGDMEQDEVQLRLRTSDVLDLS